MNKQRRKDIADLVKRLAAARSDVDEILSDIEAVKDEEQESFDNLPEGLQASEQGQATEAAVTALEEAHSALDDFDFDSIEGSLEEAAQ